MLSPAEIPAFRDPHAIVRSTAASIRPPSRVLVSEAAERHRRLKTAFGQRLPWRNAKAPFLVEPMDAFLLRGVSLIALLGPTQWGKSEVFLNVIGHAAKYRPADIGVLMPGEKSAKDFGERRIDERLIKTSPDYQAALGSARGDDRTTTKIFKNGARVDLLWPTADNLASKELAMVLIDERDRIDDDIGGEGDPVDMAKNRVKRAGAAGKVGVASSIGRVNGSGIQAIYRASDRRLWFVPCPGCGEYFSPGFDEERRSSLECVHLPACHAEEELDQAVAGACMNCPAGCVIVEQDRDAMNARGLWLASGQSIAADGTISGQAPRNPTRGYWFFGLMSPFERWADLFRRHCEALLEHARAGDDTKLKSVVMSGYGLAYVDPAAGVPVDIHDLEMRRQGYQLREVPAGVRFLTAAVDVQGNRFEVAVWGWGDEYECWLIDRFAIRQAVAGGAELRPDINPEDWNILLDLVLLRTYPLAEDHALYQPGAALRVANTAIDTGGAAGVSEHAKTFWRFARRKVSEWRITLVKGAAKVTAPLVPRPTYELDANNKEKLSGPSLFVIGVTRWKDLVHRRLGRVDPGPGHVHLPRDLEDRYCAELGRERKEGDQWVRAEGGPNETWDLLIYGTFAARRVQPYKIDWANPPSGLRPVVAGAIAPAPQAAVAPQDAPAPVDLGVGVVVFAAAPDRAPPPPPAAPRRRGQGWKI